jgi:RNA polymerase sigma-70 factor, ECF subfamily
MIQDATWYDSAFRAARPRAISALLRWFGSVDLAEEAFQEACLKALVAWQRNGAPKDPLAWLVLVGRNAGVDGLRRSSRSGEFPADWRGLENPEDKIAGELDDAACGDDVLRLLFICCHRELPSTQQIVLALKVVCGLTVTEIARAFLVSEAAMEQRITRAKRAIRQADVPFETPSAVSRAERLSTVSAMIYLMFTQGHSVAAHETARADVLAHEAIRLARILGRFFPSEPEVAGLLGLLLLHQSRAAARFDAEGIPVLLEFQDRSLWDRQLITEGIALTNRAFRMRRPGPYQLQAAIAALHARSPSCDETDWKQIERLYRILADMLPSAVVSLNHAVAISRAHGPEPALEQVTSLDASLDGYFWFHAVRGHLLEKLGRREDAEAEYRRSLELAQSVGEAINIRACIDRVRHPAG